MSWNPTADPGKRLLPGRGVIGLLSVAVSLLVVAAYAVLPVPRTATPAQAVILPIIYVDADSTAGVPDGSSWALAYPDLQDALTGAVDGDEIWVAEGTYKPGALRTDSFVLVDGVGVYGGFAGTETLRSERDWVANPTILLGDVNDDDNATIEYAEPTRADNNYHVVRSTGLSASAVLDGFTVSGGNANLANGDPDNLGGGMFNVSSSPTVTNVAFTENTALFGGAMYNSQSSSPTVNNATFTNNTGGVGGGMYNRTSSSPTVTNTIFTNNAGGGMYNVTASSPEVTDVTFSNNTGGGGAGMTNNGSSPTLTNVAFTGNTSTFVGGGMNNGSASSPVLTNVTFTNNSAGLIGGGMWNEQGSSPTMMNLTFTNNTAEFGGGMYNRNSSSPTMTNVTFIGNDAEFSGGGMYNKTSSAPVLTNVTFFNNTGGASGAGVFNEASSPVIRNTILWGNTTPSGERNVNNFGVSDPSFQNSLVGGGIVGLGQDLLGNLDADPLFSDAEGRLGLGSPAINAGLDSLVPVVVTTDLDGNPRNQLGTVDMGAFEFTPVIDVVALSDVDTDGHGELAVLLYDAGAGRYVVVTRDAVDGALVSAADLPLTAAALDVEAMGSELVVLYRTTTNGLYRIRRFDAATGGSVGSVITIGSLFDYTDLEVVSPTEVAVVGASSVDGRVRVRVDELGVGFTNYSVFGTVFTGDDLEVTPAGHLAVLGVRPGDGVVRTRVVDPFDSSWVQYLFGSAYTGDDLEINAGGDLVVLGTRADGMVRVREVEPGVGATSYFYATVYTGDDLEVLSTGEYAVLGERASNGQVRVRRVTPGTGVAVNQAYGTSHTGLDLVETSAGEYAVLGGDRSSGALRVRHIDPTGTTTTDIPYP